MRGKDNPSTMNRLFKDLLKNPIWIILACLLTVLQVLLTVYLPVLTGKVVDLFLEANQYDAIMVVIWQMCFVIISSTILQWINPLIYNHLIVNYGKRLREDFLHKLHHLPFSTLDRLSVGDLVSRLTTDIEQLQNGLTMIFNQFLVGVLTIILTIVFMARIDWFMLLLVLVLSPLSIVIARFISSRVFSYFRQQTDSRGSLTQFVDESISQENLVQSFNAQDQFIRRFDELNGVYANYSQKATFFSSTVNPTTRLVNSLIYAGLVGVGAVRIAASAFTIGQLTTFLNYVNQYTKPINDISSVLSELQSALACAERVYSTLDLVDEEDTVTRSLTFNEVQGAIEFSNLSFSYQPEKEMMKDLSLSIPAGSRVGVVGPTGAGKTTLINLLMRFYDYQKGDITIDGTPIHDISRDNLHQLVNMVLQDTWLKNASIHDNIAYGKPDASREEVIEAAESANADFFIRQLPNGYDTILSDNGASLSQGQRQLLAIARIFVRPARVLILDEATSSIDTRTELLVQEAFERAMQGKTSFVIAHRLSTIRHSDIILVMVDGNIVEHGNHDQLMAQQGVYYQMITAQH